jgi:predicted GNAT family acetyltransferase
MEHCDFIHNTAQNRFELHLPDGTMAFIAYRPTGGNTLLLYHTEVPPQYEGKGIGSRLVEKSLSLCKEEGKQVIPICSFIDAYIRRHPQWKEIVCRV